MCIYIHLYTYIKIINGLLEACCTWARSLSSCTCTVLLEARPAARSLSRCTQLLQLHLHIKHIHTHMHFLSIFPAPRKAKRLKTTQTKTPLPHSKALGYGPRVVFSFPSFSLKIAGLPFRMFPPFFPQNCWFALSKGTIGGQKTRRKIGGQKTRRNLSKGEKAGRKGKEGVRVCVCVCPWRRFSTN